MIFKQHVWQCSAFGSNSLYAEGFVGYYRGRYLKETSQNRLLLTPEKSLTMKLHRSPTNNSDGIFSVSFSFILRSVLDRFSFILRSSSVHPPFILRSSSVQPPFELRSSSVRAPFNLRSSSVRAPFNLRSSSVQPPFNLRSSSVHPPFILRSSSVRAPFNLRSFSVHSPFILRSGIEDWSKNERRIIGGKTEMYRNSNGKPRERRFEQKLYFKSLKFKLLWQDLPLTLSLFCIIT